MNHDFELLQGVKKLPLLLCPLCKKQFPFIKFIKSTNKIDFNIKCSCIGLTKTTAITLSDYIIKLKEMTTMNGKCLSHQQKSNVYCIHCIQWLCKQCLLNHKSSEFNHILVNNEVDIQISCSHSAFYISYCKSCNCNYCTSCNSSIHTKHDNDYIRKFNKYSVEKNYLQLMQNLIANQEIKKDLCLKNQDNNKSLEKRNIEAMPISTYNKCFKKKLKLLVKQNRQINEDLSFFYHCLIYTLKSLQSYPIYQLIEFFDSIQINRNEIKMEMANNRFEDLKKHLRNNYIIDDKVQYHFTNNLKINYRKPQCIIQLSRYYSNYIAVGLDNGSISLWNLKTSLLGTKLEKHRSEITCLVHLDKIIHLASAANDQTIKIWNLETCQCTRTIFTMEHLLKMVKINDSLITCEASKFQSCYSIFIRSTRTFSSNQIYTIKQFQNMINYSSNQIAICTDNKISICNISPNQLITIIKVPSTENICLVQLTDGRLVSSTGDDNPRIKIWNKRTFNCEVILEDHYKEVLGLLELKNKQLLSYSIDSMKFWDVVGFICNMTISSYDYTPQCLIQLNDEKIAFIDKEETKSYDYPFHIYLLEKR